MTISELKKETIQLMEKHPNLKEEIKDFYYLAISEIEEGGSESHECHLALSSMQEIIEEENER